MNDFLKLYHHLVKATHKGKLTDPIEENSSYPQHLDCLLHPHDFPPVIATQPCHCDPDDCKAQKACLFDAISRDAQGNITISPDQCTGCYACILQCAQQNLTERKELLPVITALMESKVPVYALVAPAFISQFSSSATPGKIRSALKALGFAGMIEVSLFADILTLKEALEFDQLVKTNDDFMLTSCCCPIWIAMIRKVYHQFMPKVPGSVSPMVACGRTVKKLHSGAITVFIGPCLAKKAEAREADIQDAVDYVLTFEEMQDFFEAAGIHPEEFHEEDKDHSSAAGRSYAYTGGVTWSVSQAVQRISPERSIQVNGVQADGVPACRELLERLQSGQIDGNFLEGMGCRGGCVGGPKAILSREEGRVQVAQYAHSASYETPLDNPYVIDLLHRLGFESIEELLHQDDIFTRQFQ